MRHLILLFLVIAGCTYNPTLTEEDNQSSGVINDSDIPAENIADFDEPAAGVDVEETEKPAVTERDVRAKFDFSLLTPGNCDFHVDNYQNEIAEVSDDLEDLEDDLRNRIKASNDTLAELNSENESSPFWSKIKERYDELQQDIDDLDERIEDTEKLKDDMEYTIDEIREECIVIKKRKP